MNIVILSQIDYAGSGFKLFEALKRHTDHDIQLFSGTPDNKLRHPTNHIVTNENRNVVQQYVDRADILHFKGDWIPKDGYLGLKIPKKKIVITTSGTYFRKKEHGGFGKFTSKDYGMVTLKTSFETDLLYPEYSDIWTPHPIDSDDKKILYRQTGSPVFLHMPSCPERKGTDFVRKVFNILKRKIPCRTEIISGVNFEISQEMKKIATIYFDQFVVGFYGNSALEAMQWGIPVVCWISPWAIEQAKGKLDDCPIINRSQNSPERTADKIIELYANQELAVKTKEWCDSHHGYRAVAKQWDKLYKSI
jgi:hypothetical protein